ncbi:MAG TPA: helix-turn-helix transcriptional regulator [Steroidobacteraceae bacterium]
MDESTYLKSIGSAIRKRRRALGISEARLARAVGVRREVLRALEEGRHDPTLELLLAISAQLRMSAVQLLMKAEQQGDRCD